MQIIFTSDTHFDSRFTNENAFLRCGELISCFKEIVDYGKKLGCAAILLGGDLFDTPYPSEETKAALKNIIASASEIKFIAICGNHDPLFETAFYSDLADNFYVFPDKITPYKLQDITIYGISENSEFQKNDPFKDFKAEGKFITLSHGDIYPASLSETGASLCLLGHIHKTSVTSLSSGANAIYSGTPAGRGFDECGQKGFYVIDTDDFSYKFINTSAKIYKEYQIDASGIQSPSELIALLENTNISQNEIARAVIVGALKAPFTIDCEKLVGLVPKFLEIKDKTEIDIDVMESISENTLEGEFVRLMVKELEKTDDKEKVLLSMKEGILALRSK